MAGATQAAVAAAQINQNAMLDVSRMVSSSLDRAAKERAMQVDIMQSMVGAAQDFKKQEMDNFFRTKELDLRGKQLELESQYKGMSYDNDSVRLRIAQQQADTDQLRVNSYVEAQKKGENNKDYLNTLAKEAVDTENTLKQEKDIFESEYDRLNAQVYGRKESAKGPAVKGMTSFQLFKDKKDPNGAFNKLKGLESSYPKAQREKDEKLGRIRSEMKHISEGGDPGIYYPKINVPSSNTSTESTSFENNSNPDNLLLPLPTYGPNDPINKLNDDAKAGVMQIDEELGRLQGETPNVDYQAPMSEAEEQKIKDDYDREVLSQIFSPAVPVEEVPAFINELSPKAKTELAKRKALTESTFLLNIGTVRGFDPSEKYDTEKNPAYVALSERLYRSGGSIDDVVSLQEESNDKLMEFKIAATNAAKGTDAELNEDVIKLNTQKMYKAWALSRHEESNKNITTGIEDAVRSGSGSGIEKPIIKSKSGKLDDFENIRSSFSEDPSLKIKLDEEKRIASYEKEFDQFYDDKKQFNKAQFFNVARGTRLGSAITGYSFSNTPISDDPYVSEKPERELYNKIKNMSQVEAKKYWMDYKNPRNSKSQSSVSEQPIFTNFNN